MKKIFLLVTTVFALMLVLIFGVSAEENISGKCGDDAYWTYDNESQQLVISGSGDMYSYDYGEAEFLQYDIKEVIIEDSITKIGDKAFGGSNITKVIMSDSVTVIGEQTFANCFYLEHVTFSESLEIIGLYAFSYCESLTDIKIPATVTTIGASAFSKCTSLKNITIPDSVTSIGVWAFLWCDSLESIFVDSDNKFYSSDAFGVLFNKDKTELIQYPIGSAYSSYTVPNSVTIICEHAFDECNNIESVNLLDNIISIENEAFYGCDKLNDITIPASVTSIGDSVFAQCNSLESIFVDSDNEYYSCDNFGVLFNKNKTELLQYPIGSEKSSYVVPNGVEIITFDAFAWCNNIVDIIIPDSIKTIKAQAFMVCPISNTYYLGSETQWELIDIHENNRGIIDSKIHYLTDGVDHYLPKRISPTCTEIGQIYYSCSCGHSYTEIIPPIGHKYNENGVCEICGDEIKKDFFERIKDFFQQIMEWFKNLFRFN